MPSALRMTGADDLGKLAADLKQAGRNDLRKEMLRGIRTATRPAVAAVRISAQVRLPRRGGLAREVAAEQITSRTTTTGRNVGVRIQRRRGQALEQGRLRHPVFGNRDVWVTQEVSPEWFTRPLEMLEPSVQVALKRVLDNITRDLAR